MLTETIRGLNIQPNGIYADLTFGGGGHSRAILEALGEGGKLYSFDQDLDTIQNEELRIKNKGQESLTKDSRWQFVHSNFRYLSNWMDYYGVEQLDGLLADLGVSFHHFDSPERGFSFRYSAPLDMRMNQQARHTAADILNTYDEDTLARVLYLYGEIKQAKPMARAICTARTEAPILRTEDLIRIAMRLREVRIDPDGTIDTPPAMKKDLARLFQALRIEVNDELGALREMLLSARDLIRPGGRIAILTYHSLEDRLVKNFLRSGNLEGEIEKDFYGNVLSPWQLIEKGATASEEEVARNPRSRSAKLRIAEKKQMGNGK